MAFEVNLQTVSVPASADLSTKQFLFGTINASGQVAVVGAENYLLAADAKTIRDRAHEDAPHSFVH